MTLARPRFVRVARALALLGSASCARAVTPERSDASPSAPRDAADAADAIAVGPSGTCVIAGNRDGVACPPGGSCFATGGKMGAVRCDSAGRADAAACGLITCSDSCDCADGGSRCECYPGVATLAPPDLPV